MVIRTPRSPCRHNRGLGLVLQPPAAELQMLEEGLGHDLLGHALDGQPALAEIAQDAGRHLAQPNAQVEQEAVANRSWPPDWHANKDGIRLPPKASAMPPQPPLPPRTSRPRSLIEPA